MRQPRLVGFDLPGLMARADPGIEPALRSLAGRFERHFAVLSPTAPGLVCLGGTLTLDHDATAIEGVARISATGTGTTVRQAAIGCLGEAADLLSQYERPGDRVTRSHAGDVPGATIRGWVGAALGTGRRAIDWTAARHALTGAASWLPADLCLRRRDDRRSIEPVGPLSAGVAAGASAEAAALRAVLELCERDALALWWLGGRPARRLPARHPAAVAGDAMIAELRRGTPGRVTALLDITVEIGVPVIAAISRDARSRGLACGAAARLDPAAAAEAAVLELCQMEMAAPLAAAKLAQAERALNPADRRHLSRHAWSSEGFALLEPAGLSELPDAPEHGPDPLADLVGRLHQHGIEVHLVDLTRGDVGVPVVRAVAPDLQPYGNTPTERLLQLRARSDTLPVVPDVPLF